MTPFLPTHPNSNPNPSPSNIDLGATISLLKDLAAHAEASLSSFSAFFSFSCYSPASAEDHPFPDDPGFCCCPYDPRHRTPPESLFRHSLRCPSSHGAAATAALLDQGFLETLRYPNTLKSEADLRSENPFVRPLPESDADLCFSLDKELGEVGSGFFYKDCPGVVTFPEPDGSGRTFTLPSIMSVECANFVCDRDVERGLSKGESSEILPSEFWALRCEVKAWKDYPVKYSYTAARVASCMPVMGEPNLPTWVILNSPCYGILVDTAMRDHIYLLLKLCLKAIRREAVNSLELISCKDGFLDPRSLSLECPCLARSLMWLVSQLSILYGQTNGKFFAIDMVAESFLYVGASLLFSPLDEQTSKEETYGSKLDADVGDRGSESKACGDVELANPFGNVSSGQVFVSQIAAAVAALHERSLLEDRIKALRFPQSLSKSQLINELSYASTKANEERARRPNYRAILEHDGLLWWRSQNQESGKMKTREELLAEERDYKRRRISYRAKKVKRTTTQVIHDIIEEHMEEIKQAGGIGCNVKGTTDTEMLLSGSLFQSNTEAQKVKSSDCNPSEANIRDSHVYRESLPVEHNATARIHGDFYYRDRIGMNHVPQNPQHKRHGIEENCKSGISKDERHINYGSRSFSNYGSYRYSQDHHTHQRQQGDNMSDNDSFVSSHWSKDSTSRSILPLKSAKILTREEYSQTSDSKSRSRSRSRNIDSHRLKSVTENVFEDRYDPSGSYDRYGDVHTDVSSSGKYSPVIDADGHNDLQTYDHCTKKCYHDHHKR